MQSPLSCGSSSYQGWGKVHVQQEHCLQQGTNHHHCRPTGYQEILQYISIIYTLHPILSSGKSNVPLELWSGSQPLISRVCFCFQYKRKEKLPCAVCKRACVCVFVCVFVWVCTWARWWVWGVWPQEWRSGESSCRWPAARRGWSSRCRLPPAPEPTDWGWREPAAPQRHWFLNGTQARKLQCLWQNITNSSENIDNMYMHKNTWQCYH